MKKRKNPTAQEIDEQAFYASEGDPDALAWLQKQNALMSKAANERMRYFRNNGYVNAEGKGTAAYNNAVEDLADLGQSRFLYRKGMSAEELRENMIAARTFLESQTSTVKGELKRRENIIAGLEKKGWIEFSDKTSKEENKKEFLKFLDSDEFQDLFSIGSGPLITGAFDAIEKGAKVSDLLNMFDEYKHRNDVDKFNVWDSWTRGYTSVKTAEELKEFSMDIENFDVLEE